MPKHILELKLREEDKWIKAFGFSHMKLNHTEPAWSFEVEGKIQACAGIQKLWPGVAELWIFADRDVIGGLTLVRSIRRVLFDFRDALGLHRLQASVKCNDPQAQKLVSFLGMEKEGVKEAYDPEKKDYFEYVLVSGGK